MKKWSLPIGCLLLVAVCTGCPGYQKRIVSDAELKAYVTDNWIGFDPISETYHRLSLSKDGGEYGVSYHSESVFALSEWSVVSGEFVAKVSPKDSEQTLRALIGNNVLSLKTPKTLAGCQNVTLVRESKQLKHFNDLRRAMTRPSK